MPPISTTLPIDLTLHLVGTLTRTTSTLTDPPRPEVDTLAVEGVSIYVEEWQYFEGLDGVSTQKMVGRRIDLTSGLGPSHGNLGMFLNRLLDALGDEVDDAVLGAGG